MEFETLTKEQIEINILKSRVESLEVNEKFLMKNWIDWKNSTKNIGQKLMISLEEILSKKENNANS